MSGKLYNVLVFNVSSLNEILVGECSGWLGVWFHGGLASFSLELLASISKGFDCWALLELFPDVMVIDDIVQKISSLSLIENHTSLCSMPVWHAYRYKHRLHKYHIPYSLNLSQSNIYSIWRDMVIKTAINGLTVSSLVIHFLIFTIPCVAAAYASLHTLAWSSTFSCQNDTSFSLPTIVI